MPFQELVILLNTTVARIGHIKQGILYRGVFFTTEYHKIVADSIQRTDHNHE